MDFYHASEHVWALEKALYGEDHAREWVEQRLHELRHGQEQKFLEALKWMKVPPAKRSKEVKKEQKYFTKQKKRMNYQELDQRGWPIGSGAVESACSDLADRFKRRGQIWTERRQTGSPQICDHLQGRIGLAPIHRHFLEL